MGKLRAIRRAIQQHPDVWAYHDIGYYRCSKCGRERGHVHPKAARIEGGKPIPSGPGGFYKYPHIDLVRKTLLKLGYKVPGRSSRR